MMRTPGSDIERDSSWDLGSCPERHDGDGARATGDVTAPAERSRIVRDAHPSKLARAMSGEERDSRTDCFELFHVSTDETWVEFRSTN